jgi:hypothetical protein
MAGAALETLAPRGELGGACVIGTTLPAAGTGLTSDGGAGGTAAGEAGCDVLGWVEVATGTAAMDELELCPPPGAAMSACP